MKRLGGDEPFRAARQQRLHLVAGRDEQPHQLARLVGGDSASDTHENPGHGDIVANWLRKPRIGSCPRGTADARVDSYHSPPMIEPRIDDLLEHVDSRYALVIVAAKRARQINSYYHNLGEGTFEEFPPPMIDTGSKNYLTIALEEVAAGKLKYHYR
jgi:DNA-directed RNA polymerase subunit omega